MLTTLLPNQQTCENCRRLSLASDLRLRLIPPNSTRPRGKRPVSGPGALTTAEHNVAVLAARGLSNPQIAQSLFITRKTVEKHLGNAYLKLQISSRLDLVTALTVGARSESRRAG